MGSDELFTKADETEVAAFIPAGFTLADVRRLAMEYLAEIEERCESMKYDPLDTITLAPFADLLKEKNYG